MCGRFVGFRSINELIEYFPIDVSDIDITENFNKESDEYEKLQKLVSNINNIT